MNIIRAHDRPLDRRALTQPGVLRAFGLHPWAVTGQDAAALAALERLLPEAAALGETGLDASPRFKRTLDSQRAAFAAQLTLAKRFHKPTVLHVVGAHKEALGILRREGPFPRAGLVHGFTGNAATAGAYRDLGFLISLGHRRCDAVAEIPGESLLVESDADRPGRDLPTIARTIAEAIARSGVGRISIDAIDSVTAKCGLLARCRAAGIPVVTSTGSGGRLDPTKVRTADLGATQVDPLARDLRRILRQKYGFPATGNFGITAVYSDEFPTKPMELGYDNGKGFRCVCPQGGESGFTCESRNLIMGTAGFVTGAFGFAAAGVAVRTLLKSA